MDWTAGELRTIELGQYRKRVGHSNSEVRYAPYEVPAPYDRIVNQLIAESVHSQTDLSHESCRRGVYALETLEAFGDEIKAFKAAGLPPATFRSTVLTPILQRQRAGVCDAYRPFVQSCIAGARKVPTIKAVSQFYLGSDPTDPAQIPTYCRNLLYIPEARWHLGAIMKGMDEAPDQRINTYNRVQANTDKIMASPLAETHKDRDHWGIPLLSCTEIEVIFDEGLQKFFMPELALVVGAFTPPMQSAYDSILTGGSSCQYEGKISCCSECCERHFLVLIESYYVP